MTVDTRTDGELIAGLADILRSEGSPERLIGQALELLGRHLGAATVVFTDHEDEDPSVSTIAYEWRDGSLPALLGRRFVNEDFADADSLARSSLGWAARSADVRSDPALRPAFRDAFLALGAVAYYSIPYVANGRIKFALSLLLAAPHAWTADEARLIGDAIVRLCTMLERDRALDAMQQARQQQAELERSRHALEQSRRLSTLGLLLAGVSHELNNPLSIIGVHNALLADELAPGPLAEHCEAIARALQRCQGLVQSYLALSRPAAPQRREVDLHALCRLACELQAHGLRKAGIALHFDFQPGTERLHTDPDQLLQVLVNLVLNAQRALQDVPAARRQLRLSTRMTEAGGMLGIEVEDRGPGIAEADRPRLFEPFFTTHADSGGTGLGLALSSRIAVSLGGRLQLLHSGSQGSCLRVELPVAVPAAPDFAH